MKKHQMDISEIKDKILFLYSQGPSTREITDKLLPVIRDRQNRMLESVYAMVVLDAIHYEVREDGMVAKKAVYIVIGTDLEGKKDVLGIWIGANEGAKYWLVCSTD